MTIMNAIEISNLSKTYKKGLTIKFEALQGLNLAVEKGVIFGFLGSNGAGKSTTIKLILNIIKPASGEILIYGEKSSKASSRQRIGYLPENPIFYEYLTPEELLLFVGKTFGMSKEDIVERGNKLIVQMGLEEARSKRLRYLSKGMIQKIGLIQAVIHDPDILILDEPASGLDPIGRRQMKELLLSFKDRGKTIFFSSHILHDVETISDRVSMLVNGTLRFCGNLSDVISNSFEEYEIKTDKIDQGTIASIREKTIDIREDKHNTKIVTAKDNMWEIIDILRRDTTIFSIEPQRKTLEEMFIESI